MFNQPIPPPATPIPTFWEKILEWILTFLGLSGKSGGGGGSGPIITWRTIWRVVLAITVTISIAVGIALLIKTFSDNCDIHNGDNNEINCALIINKREADKPQVIYIIATPTPAIPTPTPLPGSIVAPTTTTNITNTTNIRNTTNITNTTNIRNTTNITNTQSVTNTNYITKTNVITLYISILQTATPNTQKTEESTNNNVNNTQPTDTPTSSPTNTPTQTPARPPNTRTPTNTPVPTSTPTPTNTPVPTSTPTQTPARPPNTRTPTPTNTPTNILTPTNTPAIPANFVISDTFIESRSSDSDENYVNSDECEADGQSKSKAICFIRIEYPAASLADLNGKISLELHSQDDYDYPIRVNAVEGDIDFNTITWNSWSTKTAKIGKLIATIGSVRKDKPTLVDITNALISTKGILVLAFSTDGQANHGLHFKTLETGPKTAPRLTIK